MKASFVWLLTFPLVVLGLAVAGCGSPAGPAEVVRVETNPALAPSCAKFADAMGGRVDVPPCPFIDKSDYISECFGLPKNAKAKKNIMLFASYDSNQRVAVAQANESVKIMESRLLTVPCPLRVKTANQGYLERPQHDAGLRSVKIPQGDVIYYIKYLGEGVNRYWRHGELFQAPAVSMEPPGDWAEELIPCGEEGPFWTPAQVHWWRVTTPDGKAGWTTDLNSIEIEESC
jgi:hypothetical protein